MSRVSTERATPPNSVMLVDKDKEMFKFKSLKTRLLVVAFDQI